MTDEYCYRTDCSKPARGALKTTDGTKFTTVIYYDDRGAPKIAEKLCKEHLAGTALALIMDLVENDG